MKSFVEQQRRYEQFGAELIAAGILEKGFRDPEKTPCPGCGELTRVTYTLSEQAVSCQKLHVSEKPGCGEPFTLRAAAPMHMIGWDPMNRSVACLRPTWHREISSDHPARAKYRELRNEFFRDIGIEIV